MRPDLLLVLPPLVVVGLWLLRPLRGGWMLTSRSAIEGMLSEGEDCARSLRAERTAPSAARPSTGAVTSVAPSESVPWRIPEGWTTEDVENTLLDIEFAEAYRG